MSPPIGRKLILQALLNRTRPVPDIRAELAHFPWDSEPIVLLTREHLHALLGAYLAGEIDAFVVEDWAELVEVRDDIEFENEEVHEIVFFLANLTINGPLTPDRARQIQVELSDEGVPLVRLAELEIDPAQLDAYRALLIEEIEASVNNEPGVLMLYAMGVAGSPAQIRIVEVYASQSDYEAHLTSPHFLKYKTLTSGMIRSLRLIETDPIVLRGKGVERGGDSD